MPAWKYLDNAATSFPKPATVAEAMYRYTREVGATINRSVYGRAQEAGEEALSLRERLCRLFHFSDPTHVILTGGATMGLNLVLQGALGAGDRVLVSAMEHNAVMRPLDALAERGVSFDRVPCDREGFLDLAPMEPMFKSNTRMVVMCHASNVSGTLQDVAAVGAVCNRHGVPFVLDAAQTAGHVPIDFAALGLAALVVPAHKGLLGPAGIGAVLLSPSFAPSVRPLLYGGTGSQSHTEIQPMLLPDRFESGTPNLPGIYGWNAALGYIEQAGVDALGARERTLTERFLTGLVGIPGVRLIGTRDLSRRVGVISVDFEGMDNGEVARELEKTYGILTRCGLHCAPAAHRTLGVYPQGTVRFSLGWANTEDDVDAALHAIRTVANNAAPSGKAQRLP